MANKWTHANEQLAQTIARHLSEHCCSKNYGADTYCIQGLNNPLFEELRTPQVCYECIRERMRG